MNGLANWPHFYFNVAEVGIIIGRGATLFPLLIDVLFSTLGAVTRPKSNARAHNLHLQQICSGAGNALSFGEETS